MIAPGLFGSRPPLAEYGWRSSGAHGDHTGGVGWWPVGEVEPGHLRETGLVLMADGKPVREGCQRALDVLVTTMTVPRSTVWVEPPRDKQDIQPAVPGGFGLTFGRNGPVEWLVTDVSGHKHRVDIVPETPFGDFAYVHALAHACVLRLSGVKSGHLSRWGAS